MIEIVFFLLASNTLTNAVSDRVDAPLLDNNNAPLVATLDLSNANKRVKEYVSEAMEKKMEALVKMKLEEVLTALHLEEDVKRYIDNVKTNLTVNITDDIKRISDARILEKGNINEFFLRDDDFKYDFIYLNELFLYLFEKW